MALKPDRPIERSQCGDLLVQFHCAGVSHRSPLSRNITSRTYSFYYPDGRPDLNCCVIVASTNANYDDWDGLSKEDYAEKKRRLTEDTITALERYIPDVRERLGFVEAATPLTFERYTRHLQGASFGTKFEGLAVSRALPRSDRRAVSCRQRGHHHVRLAGGGELWGDRGQ